MTWIKISEKLPPTDGKYLVFAESADKNKPFIHTAWWSEENQCWELLPTVWANAITHYMNFPTPPKF